MNDTLVEKIRIRLTDHGWQDESCWPEVEKQLAKMDMGARSSTATVLIPTTASVASERCWVGNLLSQPHCHA